MKSIIEKTIAALMIVCATSGAWATDSLEETGGFVTTSSQLAFKNATLGDLTADTLHGRFSGDWSGTGKGKVMTFNNFDRSSEASGSISCQAQLVDGGYCKSVFLTFTQADDDVNVIMTAAKSKTGGSLGDAMSSGTADASGHYQLCHLRLSRTPELYGGATVTWEAGEFATTKVGIDGNQYTITLPASGMSIDETTKNLVVAASGATTGATIDLPSDITKASILIKYSSLAAVSDKNVTLSTIKYPNEYVIGTRTSANNALTLTGYFDAATDNNYPNNDATYGSGTVPTLPTGSGYFLFAHNPDGGTYSYAGYSPFTVAGGSNSQIRWGSRTIGQISIGGPISSQRVYAWPNVEIEGVALYVGSIKTADDVIDFIFTPTAEATIDADGTYTLAGDNNLFDSIAADGEYVINVNEDATLNIPSATSVNMITFNVAANKTLTLTGNTLTAAGGIKVTGEGKVYTTAMSVLSGPIKGDGTLCYDMNNGTTKPTGLTCTKAAWKGVLWIKNSAYTGWNFSSYGSTASTVRIENVTCYLDNSETLNSTLDLVGEGLKITNGNSQRVETLTKLTGDGSLTISGTASANGNGIVIQDSSEFTGTIGNSLANRYLITFGASGSYGTSGKVVIASGRTATIANGKTWSVTSGFDVSGTLAFTGTGKASGPVTTVNGSMLDLSGFTGTAPAISGALTLVSGTTIKLPAGATLPYQIATSGNGGLIGNVTVQIGNETPVTGTVALRGGAITSLASVDIDTEKTYTLSEVFGTPSATSSYEINVTENATVNLDADTNVDVIKFNIGDGKTLKITGGKLTADTVVVSGGGDLAFVVADSMTQARNAVAGAPYRVWPYKFSSLTGDVSIDTTSVEVPAGYSYSVIDTSLGFALEFTTDKQFGSLNINFSGGRGGTTNLADARVSDNASYSGLMHGAAPVVGTSWNDVPAQNATDVAVAKHIRQDGSVSSDGTATITLSGVKNPYTTGSNDGDRILYGYCDDGNSPVVTINNIPFAKYRVIVYAATDDNKAFCPKTINGVSYSTAAAGSSVTPTIPGGTGAWGASTSRSELAEGVNYLISDVISGTTTVTINNPKTSLGRASIPAVQIMEVGVYNTYDIDAAGTYNLTDIFPSVSDGYLCEINVKESATLNIGALSGTVSFNVASGKSLTISGSGSITTSASILPNSGGIDLSGNTLTIANASGTIIASDSITIGNSGLQIPLGSTLSSHTIMMKVENIPSTASRLLGWAVNYNNVASSLDNYLSYTGSNLEQHFYYGKVWDTTYGSTAWTRDASEHWVAVSYVPQEGVGARTYLDGTEKVVGTGLNWPGKTTDKILVGGIALNSAEPATGMIVKDVHVYDDALTAAQVATVTAALNKGWTVGASGTALTSATLRALPGNDSVLVSGAMTVKSDGSLAFANGVSIKLPAEATLPYQIASSGDCWVDNVSLQFGEETPSTVTIRIENGYIVGTATPRTISSDENLGSLDDGEKYFINVTDDATVTIDQDVSEVGYVVFNVSAGKVLKLDETAHSLDCPYEIIADPFSIAASATKTFTAGTAVEWYPQIGSATTGNGAISSSGTTIVIDNASSLSAGNYTLVRWVTPQKMSSGYGYVASLNTTGLAAGLTAELVYCVDRIVLRVYDTAAQAAKGTIKIWPYGDSITEGFNAGGTKANYRVLLAQKLSLLGYNVEMVGCYGQINQADGTDPAGRVIPDAWKWHSAKHGATAGPTTSAAGRANLCENVDTLCAQAGNPDVVLLLVGANDIVPATGLSAARVVSSITNIVAHLVANLPNSKIVVGNQLGIEEGYTPGNYSHVTSMIPQVNNLLDAYFADLPEGFEGKVFFADLNTYVKSGEYAVLYGGDHLHPDWLGHDQMAEGWLSVVTNQFTASQTFPSATAVVAPTSEELGAANKVELVAYRRGFNLCRRIDIASNLDTSDPYAVSGDGVTANIEKVGYFVEYVRADNNAHKWVWVDMDAFGTTLDDIGLPNANHQQVVTSLHVKSNHNGIEDVAADDDTVTGFVEFSPYDYTGNVSGITGAPSGNASCCDWNDTLSDSGSYGSMQVHRISPSAAADGVARGGQVLFAYNNWQSSTSAAEFGIGNFSSHFYRGASDAQSFDYTYTANATKMNADAYSVKRIEIWTKAVYTAEMSGNSNFSALTFSPTLPGDISECDLVVNVTDDATLTFDSAKSVGVITFNIAENKTLTLDGTSNLTVGKVVVSGPGKIAFTASPEFGALRVASNATIVLASGQSITLTGALTVDSGVTLTMEPASLAALTGTMISAGSVVNNGTVALTAPDSGSDYSIGITETSVTLRRVTKNAFTYNPVPGGNTPSGWITTWGGESLATTSLRVGPSSDVPYVYHVASGKHPWVGLAARTSGFSYAIYADVSQMESDKGVITAFGNTGKGLFLYRDGNYVKLAHVVEKNITTPSWVPGVAVSAGYHLYTVTFDPTTGAAALYLDDGTVSAATDGSTHAHLGTQGLNTGFQLGSVYEGVGDSGFKVGVGMAVCAVRGYDVALQPEEVATISESFPATDGNVTWNVVPDNADNTVIVTSTTFGDSNYIGQSKGTLTIPAGSEVNVKHIRVLNNGNSNDRATVNIAGTLNITSESTNPNTWADRESNKGVLFGHYYGQATYNITGSLIATNTYIETVYTASTQLLDISGGTVKTKALYANNGNSTVKLRDGGTLEVAEIRSDGGAITKEFKYGTFRVTADATETRAINFSAAGGYATTLDPYGHTLTLQSAALTGSGDITVADSSVGGDGKVVFVGGSSYTGRLILTDDNAANIDISGYTGTVLCQGTAAETIAMFDGFAGTVYFTGNVDATGIDLSDATVHIADNCTFTADAGKEGALVLGSGAAVTLKVDDNTVKYEGYVPAVSGSGTVGYYNTTTSAAVSGADYVNGNNLLPYYNVWSASATASENTLSANAAARWKSDDGVSGVLPADNKNVAFKLENGNTVTLLVDATKTFNDIQVFGNGKLIIQKSGDSDYVMTVRKGLYTTANTTVQIDSGLAFESGAMLEIESAVASERYVGVNCGTSESPFEIPFITGSGLLIIAEGKGLTTGSMTVGTLTVQGALALTGSGSATTASVSAGGVIDVSSGTSLTVPTLTVNGTVNMGGNTLSATTISGTGRVEYTSNKLPDASSWATGTESTGWRGTVAFCQTANLTGPNLNSYGNAYSTVALTGVSGSNTYLPDDDITTNVRIEGPVTINNGNPIDIASGWTQARVVKIASLEVDGALTFVKTGNTAWNVPYMGFYYAEVLKCGGEGSINIGNQFGLRVDAVDFAEALSGNACQVPLTLTRGGDNKADGILYGPNGVADEAIPVTVDGAANGQKLVHATISAVEGLYLAVARVGSAYYATVADAVANAGEEIVTPLEDGSLTLTAGQTVKIDNSGTPKITVSAPEGYVLGAVAKTGYTEYTTVGTVSETSATITTADATVELPAAVTTLTVSVTGSTFGTISAPNVPAEGVTVKYNNMVTTGAYLITKVGDVISFDINTAEGASVTINDVAIKVKPEVAESSPMTLGDTTPRFTVKTIPGLYYVAETCSTPDGEFTSAGTPQQATSTSTSIETTDEWGGVTVKYYRIKVSTTGN